MGKAHAFGYSIAARVFDLPFELELHTIAEISDDTAAKAASSLALQLQLIEGSESMGDHDSGSDDWWCVG